MLPKWTNVRNRVLPDRNPYKLSSPVRKRRIGFVSKFLSVNFNPISTFSSVYDGAYRTAIYVYGHMYTPNLNLSA
jgi:hypothetical protein